MRLTRCTVRSLALEKVFTQEWNGFIKTVCSVIIEDVTAISSGDSTLENILMMMLLMILLLIMKWNMQGWFNILKYAISWEELCIYKLFMWLVCWAGVWWSVGWARVISATCLLIPRSTAADTPATQLFVVTRSTTVNSNNKPTTTVCFLLLPAEVSDVTVTWWLIMLWCNL